MPFCKDYQFLVIMHCDLSGWIKAKPLCTFFSQVVVDFFWEDIISHHGYFRKLVIDGRLKNKDAIAKLAKKYGVIKVIVFAYHFQTNEMIKRGHKPIVNALSKISDERSTN